PEGPRRSCGCVSSGDSSSALGPASRYGWEQMDALKGPFGKTGLPSLARATCIWVSVTTVGSVEASVVVCVISCCTALRFAPGVCTAGSKYIRSYDQYSYSPQRTLDLLNWRPL